MIVNSPFERINEALAQLGFLEDPDFITNAAKAELAVENEAIGRAYASMGVVGLFAPWSALANGAKRRIPLLYVVCAEDDAAADQAQRSIWSQSLVPLILVIFPNRVQVRNGFSPRDGRGAVVDISDLTREDLPASLASITPLSLRSSASFRNFSQARSSRIDTRLFEIIKNVNQQVRNAVCGLEERKALVNALIGRMLYLFVLVDRGIVTQSDVTSLRDAHGRQICPDIQLFLKEGAVRELWPAAQFWGLMDAIDEAFNGTIFRIEPADRKLLGEIGINFVRDFLRKDDPVDQTATQIGLFDVDYAALRTETISAIYEQFFAVEDPERRSSDGAFFTPVFLVDYVLDELDAIAPLTSESVVCDPAAGSGAFLVSAFRRIVERTRNDSSLNPSKLAAILTNCIHGWERNAQAANVARFSLYLTMLDYLPGITFSGLLKEVRAKGRPLFPDLSSSLRFEDFFSSDLKQFACKATHVVGNPPWTRVQKSEPADKHLTTYSAQKKVAYRNAAELFFWHGIEHLAEKNASIAFVMSARSFVGSKVKDNSFPTVLAISHRIHGVTNFSHMRRNLFGGADEPAVAIFVSKPSPKPLDKTWIYNPSLISQPLDRRGVPWAIVVDRGAVETFRQSDFARSTRDWFQKLMLGPLDRAFAKRLEDSEFSFAHFAERHGIAINRGGTFSETGVPEEYSLGSKGQSDYSIRLGLNGHPALEYHLPPDVLYRARRHYRRMFSGGVLLVPRSDARYDYVDEPVAFKSTLNAMYFEDDDLDRQTERRVLEEIAAFLSSDVATYCKALVGKNRILEGRRFEKTDLARICFPFATIEDLIRSNPPSKMDQEALAHLTADVCNLGPTFVAAAFDYVDRRAGFENGIVPQQALNFVDGADVERYSYTLESSLNSLLPASLHAQVRNGDQIDLAPTLEITIESDDATTKKVFGPSLKLPDFGEATRLRISEQGDRVVCSLAKSPLVSAWTIERAYSDALFIMRETMNA